MVSKIQGHRDPFGKPLTEYTAAQLDFVLEMAAIDDPEQWVFRRAGADDAARSETLSKWRDSLLGRALMGFLMRTGIATANKGIAAWEANRNVGGLKPGLTRGGRRIDDAGDTG